MLHTRASLAHDLGALGLSSGDIVMVHAAMSAVGPVLGGPDTMIAALRDAVGPTGTILAYASCDGDYEDLLDASGRVPAQWRGQVPAFDAKASRAVRLNGVLPEFLRTTPGALRSGNPGASVTALGAAADALTRDHPLDYGYGPGSPLARLVAAHGKVLMLGAPLDTMTLLHHAEHLACIPDKIVRRYEVAFATPTGTLWRMIEEFDTSEPCSPRLPENFIEQVVEAFLASGAGTRGRIGDASAVLVDAAAVCAFAVAWIEDRAGSSNGRGKPTP